MEAALTCGMQNAYNAFVNAHQAALLDANHRIANYFARRDGSDGQEGRDAYITDLANAQAEYRSPQFCQQIAPLVIQALRLTTAEEVSRFVTDYRLTNPYTACTEPQNVSMTSASK